MPRYLVSIQKGAQPRTFWGLGTISSEPREIDLSEEQVKSLTAKGLLIKPVKEADHGVQKK